MLWLPTMEALETPQINIDMTRKTHKTTDTDIEDTPDFNTVETDHFEDPKYNNPAKLIALTRK